MSTDPRNGSDAQQSPVVSDILCAYDRQAPETFRACEKPLLGFLASGAISQLVNRQLQNLIVDPDYIGPWGNSELLIFDNDGIRLSVDIIGQPLRYIHTSARSMIVCPLSDGALHFRRYRLPENYRNDQFDPSVALQAESTGQLVRGEAITVDAAHHAIEFHAPDPMPVARLSGPPVHHLEWLFRKEDLLAQQANDADLRATHLRQSARLLALLRDRSSLPVLEKMGSHPHHTIRWAAIQSIGAIDRPSALRALTRALDDPHPHLRNAAARTLQRIPEVE